MSLNVFARQSNGFEQIVLEDKTSNTQVIILPEHGALLHAFVVQTVDGPYNIIDNYEDIDSLQKNLSQSYKSSKLSPFVCRIRDGKYINNEQTLEFQNKFSDGNSIHGLLFNKKFVVQDAFFDTTQACALLQYDFNKDEDEGYPFDYRCEIRYALLPDNLLQVQTTVTNTGSSAIPVADGWHPYFKLGGRVNDWLMQFNAESIVEFDERLIPTGQLVPYSEFDEETAIGGVSLDNCFLLKKNKEMIACTLFNPANNLRVRFLADATYPYLQIYTPPHRESIAIENLSGAPDCFNNKMGLTVLPPGKSRTFTLHYKVSTI